MELYALPNDYVESGHVSYGFFDDDIIYVKGDIKTRDDHLFFKHLIHVDIKETLSKSHSIRGSKHVISNYMIHVKQVGCASVKADFSRFDGMIYGDVLLDTRDIKIGIFRIDLYIHNKDGKDKKIRLTQDKAKVKK